MNAAFLKLRLGWFRAARFAVGGSGVLPHTILKKSVVILKADLKQGTAEQRSN
jgi:hypothetical protein